jgi:hypothetical protein
VLAQPAQSLTDLVLGVVVVALAVRLARVPTANRHWFRSFSWAGVAALAGAFHHAVMVRWPQPAAISWAIISLMVVVSVSYLLAATVLEVLGPGQARTFWLLRSVGLVAYVGAAVTGHAGVTAMLVCESLTMLAVLVLWGLAAHRRHPMARPVILAIFACGAAAMTQLIPPDTTDTVELDPISVYHLAQIAGMLLLYRAVVPATSEEQGLVPGSTPA